MMTITNIFFDVRKIATVSCDREITIATGQRESKRTKKWKSNKREENQPSQYSHTHMQKK